MKVSWLLSPVKLSLTLSSVTSKPEVNHEADLSYTERNSFSNAAVKTTFVGDHSADKRNKYNKFYFLLQYIQVKISRIASLHIVNQL